MADRLYKLVTGNRGMMEAFEKNPPTGAGWKVDCELDPDGKIKDHEAVLFAPDGKELIRGKLGPHFMADVQSHIRVHMQGEAAGQPQASQQQGVLPDGPAARVLYKGTTGHKIAGQMLQTYDDPTEGWRLQVEYYKGMDSGHVQLLDGTTVIGSGDVLPIDTLISRIAGAIRTYRAGVLAGEAAPATADPGPAQAKPPLICVRTVPTGSVLVNLWLTGEEFKKSPGESSADDWIGISRGPDAMNELYEIIGRWRTEHPTASIDTEIELDPTRYPVPGSFERVEETDSTVTPPPDPPFADAQPGELPELAAILEYVRCVECGTVHGVERQEGEVQQMLRECNQCYGARFEPCEAPAEPGTYWVVNPEVKQPAMVASENTAASDNTAAGAQLANEPPEEAAGAARQVPEGMKPTAGQVAEGELLREIQIRAIGHFPGGNVRQQFAGLEDMAASIREMGIIQPLTVNEIDGRYTLVAGERRLRAADMAGLTTVTCRVKHWTEQQALMAMLVENIQREDLNPVEEARAYKRLLDVLGSQGQVADRVGKSRVHVVEYLQLLELPFELQAQVASGVQPVKNGLEFLRKTKAVPPEVRAKVARALEREQPSSREAPKVIDRVLRECGVERPASPARLQPEAPPPAPPIDPASPVARATPQQEPPAPPASSTQPAQAPDPVQPPAGMPEAQPSPPAAPTVPTTAAAGQHAQPTEDESERQFLERRAAAIRNTLSLGIEADGIINRDDLITRLAEIEAKLAGLDQATPALPAPPQPASSTNPAQSSTPEPQSSPNQPASSAPKPDASGPQHDATVVSLFIGRLVSLRFDALRRDRTNTEFLVTLMDNWEDSLSK